MYKTINVYSKEKKKKKNEKSCLVIPSLPSVRKLEILRNILPVCQWQRLKEINFLIKNIVS